MKRHHKVLLGGLFCIAIMSLSAVATTTTVTVSVPPNVYFYAGENVTVSFDAIVSVGKTTNFTATFDVTCKVGSTTVYAPPPYTVNVITSSSVFDSKTFTVSESATGTYTVICTVSVQLSGGVSGSSGGSGSASFTVSACTGDSDYAELPPSASGLWVDTTWNLSAIMSPANPSKPNPQSIGTATGTGITGNLTDSVYEFDCDNAQNSDIGEIYPIIEDAGQTEGATGDIYFHFNVTNYNYNASVACDTCDTNPNGYYPVQSSSTVASVGPLSGSCAP